MKICKVESKREVVDIKFEVCDNKYCCKRMEKWLKIGTYHDRNSLLYDTDTGRFEIRVKAVTEYDSGGDTEAEDEDLDFCPFCGTKLQETVIPKAVEKKKAAPKKKRYVKL